MTNEKEKAEANEALTNNLWPASRKRDGIRDESEKKKLEMHDMCAYFS